MLRLFIVSAFLGPFLPACSTGSVDSRLAAEQSVTDDESDDVSATLGSTSTVDIHLCRSADVDRHAIKVVIQDLFLEEGELFSTVGSEEVSLGKASSIEMILGTGFPRRVDGFTMSGSLEEDIEVDNCRYSATSQYVLNFNYINGRIYSATAKLSRDVSILNHDPGTCPELPTEETQQRSYSCKLDQQP